MRNQPRGGPRSIALTALVVASCGSPDRLPEVAPAADAALGPAAESSLEPVRSGQEHPLEGGVVSSRSGRWTLRWRPRPSPLPEGELCDLLVELDAPSAWLDAVALEVDATMPSHGHGMNRRAQTERLAPGRFVARDLLLHMPGPWVLTFDVTLDAVTERIEAVVELP